MVQIFSVFIVIFISPYLNGVHYLDSQMAGVRNNETFVSNSNIHKTQPICHLYRTNISLTWLFLTTNDPMNMMNNFLALNTQKTIAPSVDKGWIVIWITVVDQWWLGRTKNEYQFIPVRGCYKAPASYLKCYFGCRYFLTKQTPKTWKGNGCLLATTNQDKLIFIVC